MPLDPQDCAEIGNAVHYRESIIKELVKKVSDIQNSRLGEMRIRDLNDELNQLLRTKRKWEDRIRELGGKDYREEGRNFAKQGVQLPGSVSDEDYVYFGEAKNLPKVRELFQKEAPPPPKRTREELLNRVNYKYLGLEDDKDLEEIEARHQEEEEALANKELEAKFFESKRQNV